MEIKNIPGPYVRETGNTETPIELCLNTDDGFKVVPLSDWQAFCLFRDLVAWVIR